MEFRSRFRLLAGFGTILVALAVVFARPILLYGAAGIAAILIFRQIQFLHRVTGADDALSVDQSVSAEHVTKGQETVASLRARLTRASKLELRIEAKPPLVADAAPINELRGRIRAGEYDAGIDYPIEWPVVGRTSFDRVNVTAIDPAGLFRETFERGPTPTVTVAPRIPNNVHVGEGGDQIVPTYDGHRSDRMGVGIDPAEIRQYQPGDKVRDIDWKATARLDYPHVREYELETERQRLLFVDHRSPLVVESLAESPFAYLRELALGLVEDARSIPDPIGLAVVGDSGMQYWNAPDTEDDTYEAIRTTLQQLSTAVEPVRSHGDTAPGRWSVVQARQTEARLADSGGVYSTKVRPFIRDVGSSVKRMDDDPLFETVRQQLEVTAGSEHVFILTSDADRSSVQEAVKVARKTGNQVTAFVVPLCLFESDSVADIDAVYEEYVSFEEFRRELARFEGVEAFEVAPGDRISALLEMAAKTGR